MINKNVLLKRIEKAKEYINHIIADENLGKVEFFQKYHMKINILEIN
ncbi:hypothetical protein [Caloranaerobacter sp. DY30410]